MSQHIIFLKIARNGIGTTICHILESPDNCSASSEVAFLRSVNQCNQLVHYLMPLLRKTHIEGDKHRRRGNQKITIEHIHVNDGGQAIVGNLSHEEGGGNG